MTINGFDDKALNNRYHEYFKIMDISDEQILERIELAELLDDVFLYLFTYFDAEIAADNIDVKAFYDICERRYSEALEEYGINFVKYPEVEEYVTRISKDLVDSTIKEKERNATSRKNKSIENKDASEEKGNQKIYERSFSVAENESNTVFNTMEYVDAVNGGCKNKTWITEGDSKVRSTHKAVDFQTIGINDFFIVGGYQMRFAKDTAYGADASEIANCRCSIQYS